MAAHLFLDEKNHAPRGGFKSLMPMRFVRTLMVTTEYVGDDHGRLHHGVSVIIDHDNDGVVYGKLHHDLRHHEAQDHFHGAYMSRPGRHFQRWHALDREPDCIQSYYWQQIMQKPLQQRLVQNAEPA